MKAMLSSFLGPRQETIRTAFCNYLASEMEILEDRDFQRFRNEAVKLLSGIQSMAECKGIHPNHPRGSDASKPGHPTSSAEPSGIKGQLQPRGQPTSFIVDHQQAGPSRPLTFTLTPAKHFNPHQLPPPQAKKVNTTYQDSLASLGIYSQS